MPHGSDELQIERYVEGLNLAVVMPAVHRSFYTDMAHGGKYWQFISEEVPAVVHSLFPCLRPAKIICSRAYPWVGMGRSNWR